MRDTTSQPEPSELVRASPFLMECLELSGDLDELEKLARAAVRLKELYCSIPFYARQAAEDPDYWNKFSATQPNGSKTEN